MTVLGLGSSLLVIIIIIIKIMEYVFAPVTTMGYINYLEILIEEYLGVIYRYLLIS